MSRLTKGYLIAGIGIVIWSTTGTFTGYLITNYHMPALQLAFWRNLLVCVGLAPALFVHRRHLLVMPTGQWGYYVFYGFILAVFNSIWALSVLANGAAVATVLAYSSAGFTALFAWWLFKERLGPAKLTAITLSLGGCVLVSNAYSPEMWRLNLLGVLTGLLSGVLFAGYTLLGKGAARRDLNPWTSMLYSFGFGALFILAFNLIPDLPGAVGSIQRVWPDLPAMGWAMLVFFAIGPTLLGFGLYNLSMSYLPASIANLLATTEPVLTAIQAYIFLNERMTLAQIIGGAVIVLAVLIVQLEKNDSTDART